MITQWLRTHSGAILGTVVVASNFHLLPSVIGAIASAIATACGFNLQ